MSGLDYYSRFYFNPDVSGSNIAWTSQAYWDSGASIWYSLNLDSGLYDLPNNYNDYPQTSIGQSYTGYVAPTGVFGGTALRVTSYNPNLIPTRARVYQSIFDKSVLCNIPGLFACLVDDYTIDFWVKINSGALGKQPIITDTSIDWGIYYQDGILAQKQGTGALISCNIDLHDHIYHHIEFNRSYGINRIFVDGVAQTLTSEVWNVDTSVVTSSIFSLGSFYIGCPDNTYRDVDYDIDNVRFSTYVARNIENFTPPTEDYSRTPIVTEIPSVTSGIIYFSSFLGLDITFPEQDQTICGNTFPTWDEYGNPIPLLDEYGNPILDDNGNTIPIFYGNRMHDVNFKSNFSLISVLDSDKTVLAISNGVIRFESLTELFCGFYGLTVPAIQDGQILFESVMLFETYFEGSLITNILNPGTIYELIENQITIPISFQVEIVGNIKKDFWGITFINALELEIQFDFINSLNLNLENSFSFKNSLTSKVLLSYSFTNRMLAVNELEKNFTFFNRLLTDDPVIPNPQEYNGFYFSEIHGV